MDDLKRTDLEQLINAAGDWQVSIYIPTHPAGSEQQQDPIRLKNLLGQAEKTLLEYGARRPEVEEITRPAQELLLDSGFWQHQGQGLAVFLSNNASHVYRLPNRFDELVVVGKRFDVKPLLPLLTKDGQFYILAISQNNTRLFRASRDHLSEVELTDVPKSLGEALRIDDPQKNLGFQTSTDNSKTGERPAVFYGQGVEDDKKELIRRYFQYVDQGLQRIFESESIPMVLAGVDYLHPLYHEANTYRNLLEEGLIGNPDRQNSNELHAEAWKLVEPIFLKNQQEAIDRFLEYHGQQNGLATSDLDDAVKAAIGGRVETLIVPLGAQKWGRYDPAKDSVIFEPEPTPENDDMLNFAAVQTILNSGNVYAVPKEQFPNKAEVAAILRYAI